MLNLPEGMPAPERSAYEAGFMSAEDQWRKASIAVAMQLAGGERGMLATRRDGKCQREPQRTLEELIERIMLFSATTTPDLGEQRPPATRLLVILQHLAQTPPFTPIHIKRDELRALLEGLRGLQSHARRACDTIAKAEPLTLLHIKDVDHGPLLTSLATIRESMKEILK